MSKGRKSTSPKPKKYKPQVYKQHLSNGTIRTTNSQTGKQRIYKRKSK